MNDQRRDTLPLTPGQGLCSRKRQLILRSAQEGIPGMRDIRRGWGWPGPTWLLITWDLRHHKTILRAVRGPDRENLLLAMAEDDNAHVAARLNGGGGGVGVGYRGCPAVVECGQHVTWLQTGTRGWGAG